MASEYCMIAVEDPRDKSIKAVRCRYGGYPKVVGKMLIEHYNVIGKVNALIESGHIYILRPELGDKEKQTLSWNDPDFHSKMNKLDDFFNPNQTIHEQGDGPILEFCDEQEFTQEIWYFWATRIGNDMYLFQNDEWYHIRLTPQKRKLEGDVLNEG